MTFSEPAAVWKKRFAHNSATFAHNLTVFVHNRPIFGWGSTDICEVVHNLGEVVRKGGDLGRKPRRKSLLDTFEAGLCFRKAN